MWDSALDPHDEGIPGEAEDADGAVLVRGKQLYIILKAHEPGTHLLQPLPVIFKEAVVNGQYLGCQGENAVGQEEGQDEQIPPFGIADALFPA